MSGTIYGWVWDDGWKQHRRYLPDEGNWLYENGYVVNPISGATVRVVDMSGNTEQVNQLSRRFSSSTGGSVQEATSQPSAFGTTQGTTSFQPPYSRIVPEQSHVTTSTAVYPQANASSNQYAVGSYWQPNQTTDYQVNRYVPSSNNGLSVSYGANPYHSNSSNAPAGSNVNNYFASNSGTTASVPYAVDQPVAAIPSGGVEKFFHNPEQVTDSALLERGIKSYRKFGGPVSSSYVLHPAYQVPQDGGSFFAFGKVFTTMWAEMQGSTAPSDQHTVVTTGENIWVKIRWFVVIRPGRDRSCTCLPIQTYQGRGVSKPGTIKSEHAIIHSTKKPPNPLPEEAPCRFSDGTFERDMLEPIRVVPRYKTEELDPKSRINFVRLYTVEHNTKVKEFGYVHRESAYLLEKQFYECWAINGDRR